MKLPAEARDTAGRLGEAYAWRRANLARAVRAMEACDIAVVSGEAWAVRRKSECAANEPTCKRDNLDPEKGDRGLVLADSVDWVIYGGFPTRDGGPIGIYHWETEPQRSGEGWKEFVSRTATAVLSWVEESDIENEVPQNLSSSIFYNLRMKSETGEKA